MYPIKIAVVSDLHIGEGARSRDLCPDAPESKIDEKYVDIFCDFVKRESISAHYLLVPGDITNRAKPNEFKLASDILKEIAGALNVVEKNILFVPGNHDKDWSVFPKGDIDQTGVRNKQSYTGLTDDQWIFEKILKNSPVYMINQDCYAVWRYENLLVVGFNSSWHDDPNVDFHHGLINPHSLESLKNYLDQLNVKDLDIPKLFLVHHHPCQYSDPLAYRADPSIMTNAENLLNLLREYKFDFFLHGHKHIPRIKTELIDSTFPMTTLGAGSFSYQLDWSYNGHASNQFHIVNIEGRDALSMGIYGYVKSWSYHSGHLWKLSNNSDGIYHTNGFGVTATIPALKLKLTPEVKSNLSKKDYLKWTELVSKNQELNYLPPKTVLILLDEIASDLTKKGLIVTRHGVTPEDAILLKEVQ